MPQHTAIGFGFTVRQVVEMGCHPLRETTTGLDEVVEESLERAGVAHLAERGFRSLSGGEQALTTFARVLAQCTPLLLLDEPTASLDLHHQERVMRIARDVADRGGGVLVVAHDLNLAAAYADRICLLDAGRVVDGRRAVAHPPRGRAGARLRAADDRLALPGQRLAARRPAPRSRRVLPLVFRAWRGARSTSRPSR